jgi:putative membrane protein insertion efficiency factor
MSGKRCFSLLFRGASRVLHLFFGFGPCCRFVPSCSEYAEQAFMRRGIWTGSWLTVGRLCRCHPFGASGYDPVPDLRN